MLITDKSVKIQAILVNQRRISQTQYLCYIKMCVRTRISYVLDLIELYSNGWPDDGLLQGRNM
jgi:hypothetical protein